MGRYFWGGLTMNYADIDRVNGEINMLNLKGKNYAMVPERVTAFRKLFPEGFIDTEIVSNDGTTVLMQAKVGYYGEDGKPVILATGYAQEVRGKGMVNGTSHIENCETSAVGRALGMVGLGLNGGGICSAEELVNAITAQNQIKEEEKAFGVMQIPEGAPISKVEKVPPITIAEVFAAEMNAFMQRFEITDSKKALDKFNELRGKLQESGAVPKGKKMNDPTEVYDTFAAIYANFKPSGDAA